MTRPRHVLIAGGGVAALEAALALRRLAGELVDVEVLAPNDQFIYRPLAVGEPFGKARVRRFPLDKLVAAAGARRRRGSLTAVDPETKTAETDAGATVHWDVLVLALGARLLEAIPGALTFRGPEDTVSLEELVNEAIAGRVRSLIFALPTLAAWPLPLYELALMTELRLADVGSTSVTVELVTPERRPLHVFGQSVSSSISSLLALRGIHVHAYTTPVAFRDGALVTVPGLAIRADRAVALPVPAGYPIDGLPQDPRGFVATDAHGRVDGCADIYAAGDMTTFPLKQGGLATQQADAAAEAIAHEVGAPVTPRPFHPVLRGLLLTGLTPRFLRANPLAAASDVDSEPLWWPASKIVGKYLSPFLAEHLGLSPEPAESRVELDVEIELERSHATWSPTR
jgi:sulfide:quinone oxidoreductase